MTGQNVATAILAIDHPSHASSCEVFAEVAESMGRTSTRCPCEDGWRDHLA